MARDENMIAALKRERAGYAARGMTDRVAQVDEQLAYYGAGPGLAEVPQGRTGTDPSQQTAAPATGGIPSGSSPVVGESGPQDTAAGDPDAVDTAAAAEPEAKSGRGRPRKPRDAQGNIVRE
jgi:hypothetical protein